MAGRYSVVLASSVLPDLETPELELQDDDRFFSDEEESPAAEHRPKSVPPPAARQPDQSVADHVASGPKIIKITLFSTSEKSKTLEGISG